MQKGKYIISENQTVMDLAIQLYGSIEKVLWLIQDNPTKIDALDAELPPGELINVRDDIGSSIVANELKKQNIKVATGDTATHSGGIGYWGIEENFIIS